MGVAHDVLQVPGRRYLENHLGLPIPLDSFVEMELAGLPPGVDQQQECGLGVHLSPGDTAAAAAGRPPERDGPNEHRRR
jgi:hypothetical protein